MRSACRRRHRQRQVAHQSGLTPGASRRDSEGGHLQTGRVRQVAVRLWEGFSKEWKPWMRQEGRQLRPGHGQ